MAIMYLEKAYDRVNGDASWKVLGIYSVGGKILQ